MDISPPRLFPFCVVWTPIPLITWLLPFVGHMGICRSDGVVLDFFGPFNVQVDSFGFGNPTRYLRLDPRGNRSVYNPSTGESIEQWWDEELKHSERFFRTLVYNFFGTNCHSFVAFFLNQIVYSGSMHWNSVSLAVTIFFTASHVDFKAVLKTWLPFCIITTIGAIWGRFWYIYVISALVAIILLYFAIYEYLLRAQSRLMTKANISLGV